MLNELFSTVVKQRLEKENVESVKCYFSSINKRKQLSIELRTEITEEYFIKQFNELIEIYDISHSDSISFSIDLTEEMIERFIKEFSKGCHLEFENMKRR